MVLKIAICDASPESCEIYKRLLQRYIMMQSDDTDYELIHYQNSSRLLEARFDYDVLFLETELEMDENGNVVDGIEVGRQLRKKGNRAVFILATKNSDRYADGYSATVFRYVLKPIDQQKFDTLMSETIEFWQNDNRILTINHDKQTDYIRVNDIIMIENYRKKRMIHTESQVYYVKESWESLESKLYNDKRFFKPQRGFLINLLHVACNTKTQLTMKSGTIIPFKRGCYTLYCEKIKNYLTCFR